MGKSQYHRNGAEIRSLQQGLYEQGLSTGRMNGYLRTAQNKPTMGHKETKAFLDTLMLINGIERYVEYSSCFHIYPRKAVPNENG